MKQKLFFSQIVILLFISISLSGQEVLSVDSLYMTHEQNILWLEKVMEADSSFQWQLITNRYFKNYAEHKNLDERKIAAPILIIDGVPLNLLLEEKIVKKMSSLLTSDKIKAIKILLDVPEGLHIHRAFTGMILVSLNDKKTSKKYCRLNRKS